MGLASHADFAAPNPTCQVWQVPPSPAPEPEPEPKLSDVTTEGKRSGACVGTNHLPWRRRAC